MVNSNLRLFGTDGIRGVAGSHPLTPDFLIRIAYGVSRLFLASPSPRVIIGRDTRASGSMIEAALSAGFLKLGVEVITLGVLPTAGVAFLTAYCHANLGIMISASHNSYQDNGLKFFDEKGYKLSSKQEELVESFIYEEEASLPSFHYGTLKRMDDAAYVYENHLRQGLSKELRFDGLKMVLDCAQGAAFAIAPRLFSSLGAELFLMGCTPNGTNINKNCGSTLPYEICKKVKETNADVGLCFDGDADRLLLVDEKGQLLDGDQMLALLARAWHQEGVLKSSYVVGTVMANLGLENFLRGLNLSLIKVPVGDKHVAEEMRRLGCNLGGEASGHLVLSELATTGDGLIVALHILALWRKLKIPFSEFGHVFRPLPQVLRNVSIKNGDLLSHAEVQACIAEAQDRLGPAGQLLIRKSGTEPVIRIMVQGADQDFIEKLTDEIAAEIQRQDLLA